MDLATLALVWLAIQLPAGVLVGRLLKGRAAHPYAANERGRVAADHNTSPGGK